LTNEKSGAFVPSGNIVLAVFTMIGSPLVPSMSNKWICVIVGGKGVGSLFRRQHSRLESSSAEKDSRPHHYQGHLAASLAQTDEMV
jgi:hypothetical protein